ncbi:kinesin-like nuclear fusion protein [Spiromyces aspiralis]|uniref:Kinesin-like nuclear fusion protein n=1 Tax=Spiromyces aspiralis TaxID=68401 RepID=A0ACC1HWH4_9FUNG|nr:kinesin-like nuclear fusion protein [Spiromyces aspiralis]
MVSGLRPPTQLSANPKGATSAITKPSGLPLPSTRPLVAAATTTTTTTTAATVSNAHAGVKRKQPSPDVDLPQPERVKRRAGGSNGHAPVALQSRPATSKLSAARGAGITATRAPHGAGQRRGIIAKAAAVPSARGAGIARGGLSARPISTITANRARASGVLARGAAPPKPTAAAKDAAERKPAPAAKLDENGNPDCGTDGEDGSDDAANSSDEEPPPVLKKCQSWDTKTKLENLQAINGYLARKQKHTAKKKAGLARLLEEEQSRSRELDSQRKSLEDQILANKGTIRKLNTEIDEIRAEGRRRQQQHEEEIDDLKRQHRRRVEDLQDQIADLERRNSKLSEDLRQTEKDLGDERQQVRHLDGTVKKLTTELAELEDTYRTLKTQFEHLEGTLARRNDQIAQQKATIEARDKEIASLRLQLHKEEMVRRSLHNTIQELKGNIRVFCRIRPLLADELADKDKLPIKLPECDDENEVELWQQSESATGKMSSKVYPFKFDQVFGPDSTQDEVFDEVSQLIQSALDGYPVCIFAYGQTGSGKTFTMEGSDKNEGIIPRAVRQIYETTERLKEKGWEYTLEGQFVEIYNETIQDLLVVAGGQDTTVTANSGGGGGGDNSKKKLEIHRDKSGRTYIKNVTTTRVDSTDAVNRLLAQAAKNRTVAATLCNDRSSRSHSVFTLRISGVNVITSESCAGQLNLIDLAGSERLSQSGAQGERLRETQAINKSLACLGDVIFAVGNGDKHVPYRNSKLTHLLQDSLGGGNSKTLMFVCISPSPTSAQESLCSLRFATKVNSCHIGTAKRQSS